MNGKDTILATYAMSDRVMERYLTDLSDADLLIRPVAGMNHIAWQLGHLALSEKALLERVRPGAGAPVPEGFDVAHGRDESSTKLDDPSKFETKERYVELLKQQRAATLAALESMTDADLDAPGPEQMRAMAPTVGSVMLLIGTHGLMHVGQWVAVRREKGLPVVI
jgi:uncharacterized damage-inducible protein DinB